MMLLQLEEVYSRYGHVNALKGISFDVPQGSIVALLGANGAGKTTTLRTISGTLRPTSGAIAFAGRSITHVPPERMPDMGLVHVPEGRGVFFQLTVAQNLLLGGGRRTKSDQFKEAQERVYQLFPMLYEKRNHLVSLLSGGQQQMLSLGRALLSQPKLLMVDELSFGLAPIVVKELFKLVETLNREGMTILLVEQNVGLALKVAHHAYVLSTGRIVTSGPARDLASDEDLVQAYLGAQQGG